MIQMSLLYSCCDNIDNCIFRRVHSQAWGDVSGVNCIDNVKMNMMCMLSLYLLETEQYSIFR